jgi:hypothetical protein
MMVGLVVHSADVQDRDGAAKVLQSIRSSFPWLRHVFADGGYAGPKLHGALAGIGDWKLQSPNVPTSPKASKSCRAAGSSSVPLPGSVDAGGSPRVGKIPRQRPSLDLHRPNPHPYQAHRKALSLRIAF